MDDYYKRMRTERRRMSFCCLPLPGMETKEMISERLIQYAIINVIKTPGWSGKLSDYLNSSEDDKLKIVNDLDWLEGGGCFNHAVDDETYKNSLIKIDNWKAGQLKIKEIENRAIETYNRKTKIIEGVMILLAILLGEWVGRNFAFYILIN